MECIVLIIFAAICFALVCWAAFAPEPPWYQTKQDYHHYYDQWENSQYKLQAEEDKHGRSQLYWEIWHNEVCPAYAKMTEAYRKMIIFNQRQLARREYEIPRPNLFQVWS